MKRCPFCGTKNKDSFEYCVRCSEDLASAARPAEASEGTRLLPFALVAAALSVTAVIAWQTFQASSSTSGGAESGSASASPSPAPDLPQPPPGEERSTAGAVGETFRNGVAAFRRKEYGDAIRYLEQFVSESPDNVQGHMYLGLARYYANDLRSASDAMSRAFDLAPTDPRIRNYLFVMFKQQGDYASAERTVRQFLDRAPNDADGRRELGQVLRLQGNTASSVEELQKLVESGASDRDTTLELGESLRVGGRYAEAAEVFRRAGEAEPKSAPIQHALGVTNLQAKNYKEAVGPLEKAVDIDANNPDFHLSLAQAYENLDRLEDSYREYEAFIKLKPGDPEAARVQGLLTQARKAFAEKQAMEKERAKKSS